MRFMSRITVLQRPFFGASLFFNYRRYTLSGPLHGMSRGSVSSLAAKRNVLWDRIPLVPSGSGTGTLCLRFNICADSLPVASIHMLQKGAAL